MGYRVVISDRPDGHAVLVTLTPTREESNALFLSGDSLISWPTEGLLEDGDPVLSRTCMFASEVAARPEGLTLVYAGRGHAEKTAVLLGLQLDRIGMGREDA